MAKVQKNVGQASKGKNQQAQGFKKITRRKAFGEHVAWGLFFRFQQSTDLDKLDEVLRKSYRRSAYCANTLASVATLFPGAKDKDKIAANVHCKTRWCPICQAMRMFKLIKGYAPALSEFRDPYFVTLTAPTVPVESLPDRIEEFRRNWSVITKDRYWMTNKPQGLRKAECTLRPDGMYHYHFHVIIDGRDNAEWLIGKWLRLSPASRRGAQDMRPVDGERGYVEIFKYFTKLLVLDKASGRRYIDFERMHYVFKALYRKRVYQPFGGIKAVSEDIEEGDIQAQEVTPEIAQHIWRWQTGVGYVCEDTGEVLTGDYKIPTWIEQIAPKAIKYRDEQGMA